MKTTLINDPFEDDAASMIKWLYGTEAFLRFYEHMQLAERPGQAFMNVLRAFDPDSYVRITGSLVDPFYRDEKIPEALDKITSK